MHCFYQKRIRSKTEGRNRNRKPTQMKTKVEDNSEIPGGQGIKVSRKDSFTFEIRSTEKANFSFNSNRHFPNRRFPIMA